MSKRATEQEKAKAKWLKWLKAYTEWEKACAEHSQARAEWDKATVEFDKARAKIYSARVAWDKAQRPSPTR